MACSPGWGSCAITAATERTRGKVGEVCNGPPTMVRVHVQPQGTSTRAREQAVVDCCGGTGQPSWAYSGGLRTGVARHTQGHTAHNAKRLPHGLKQNGWRRKWRVRQHETRLWVPGGTGTTTSNGAAHGSPKRVDQPRPRRRVVRRRRLHGPYRLAKRIP